MKTMIAIVSLCLAFAIHAGEPDNPFDKKAPPVKPEKPKIENPELVGSERQFLKEFADLVKAGRGDDMQKDQHAQIVKFRESFRKKWCDNAQDWTAADLAKRIKVIEEIRSYVPSKDMIVHLNLMTDIKDSLAIYMANSDDNVDAFVQRMKACEPIGCLEETDYPKKVVGMFLENPRYEKQPALAKSQFVRGSIIPRAPGCCKKSLNQYCDDLEGKKRAKGR
jgi:hypothetical protein